MIHPEVNHHLFELAVAQDVARELGRGEALQVFAKVGFGAFAKILAVGHLGRFGSDPVLDEIGGRKVRARERDHRRFEQRIFLRPGELLVEPA